MLRVMLRRWYVSIPALIVAVALPAAAWTMISSKYQTTSTISLLNSSAASSANQRTGNPFLAFDSSLTPMADFLARRLGSDQSAADLAARGVLDPASAVLAPNASGPFLTMTVTGKDQAKVLTELQTFDDYAIQQLAVIQTSTTASLPASTLIRAVVVVPPQKPTTSMKSKFEDVAGAGVFGLAILFLSVFGSEALALRRARDRDGGQPHRRGDSSRGASAGTGDGNAAPRAPWPAAPPPHPPCPRPRSSRATAIPSSIQRTRMRPSRGSTSSRSRSNTSRSPIATRARTEGRRRDVSAPAPPRLRRARGHDGVLAVSPKPDPAALHAKPARWDATSVLTVYAALIMLAPATQTVANLGALGAPATVFSVLAFLWFLAGRLTGRSPWTRDPARSARRCASSSSPSRCPTSACPAARPAAWRPRPPTGP